MIIKVLSFEKDTLRDDDIPHIIKRRFMIVFSAIYFIIFILITKFVLINIVIAVMMKRLKVKY